jgi:putative SOS response-associated peptidase YedK
MPVPLNPSDYDLWLAADTPVEHVRNVLRRPYVQLETYPVSLYVNKPEHDDPACIRPVVADDVRTP